MMLYCLPYTTFVHYGTCPFCTYQCSGFNGIAALRLSVKAALCLLRVTPLLSSLFFDQHLSAQNVYFGPTPKPNLAPYLFPHTTARAYSDVLAGARAEQATQPQSCFLPPGPSRQAQQTADRGPSTGSCRLTEACAQ